MGDASRGLASLYGPRADRRPGTEAILLIALLHPELSGTLHISPEYFSPLQPLQPPLPTSLPSKCSRAPERTCGTCTHRPNPSRPFSSTSVENTHAAISIPLQMRDKHLHPNLSEGLPVRLHSKPETPSPALGCTQMLSCSCKWQLHSSS